MNPTLKRFEPGEIACICLGIFLHVYWKYSAGFSSQVYSTGPGLFWVKFNAVSGKYRFMGGFMFQKVVKVSKIWTRFFGWPKFSSVLNQIEAVFLSKSGGLRKQKKDFHRNWYDFFGRNSKLGDLQKKGRSSPKLKRSLSWPTLGELQKKKNSNNSKSFTTSALQSLWGAVFIFRAKIGLKSTKNVLFCILFRPMGA